ncbi:hypothetical protein LSAT2_008193 [Lamellibrachia satsuma]|nr:hypothetical protein LSAT2_008193 [Lamellibrachia satsuma]
MVRHYSVFAVVSSCAVRENSSVSFYFIRYAAFVARQSHISNTAGTHSCSHATQSSETTSQSLEGISPHSTTTGDSRQVM